MRIPYDNLDYAESRLSGTHIMYKGELCYVHNVLRNKGVLVLVIDTGIEGEVTVPISSQFLDISPVKLGYINQDGECLYVYRRSARRWKQGLDLRALEVKSNVAGVTSDDLSIDANLRAAIKGEYPSLERAKEMVNIGSCSSVAFSRDWALDKKFLMFKGEIVGVGCELYPFKSYLKELLLESMK